MIKRDRKEYNHPDEKIVYHTECRCKNRTYFFCQDIEWSHPNGQEYLPRIETSEEYLVCTSCGKRTDIF